MYKSRGIGILFFIIISSLINGQSAYYPLNELKFNEDNTCHIKFHTANGSPIINKKEKRKIKSLICENLEMVNYMDSVFEPFGLPPFFSKIPIITSYSNSASHFGVGVWNLNYITALKNGLLMNYFVDERLDYKKSTVAAANELSRLWKIYGQKKTTLVAFLLSPNFVARTQEKGSRAMYNLFRRNYTFCNDGIARNKYLEDFIKEGLFPFFVEACNVN